MRKELIKHSKFLSLILRHNPAALGVELDDAGWIDVSILLAAVQRKRPRFTKDCLLEIVATCPKQRFALSEDGTRIRASQGHSIGVDLGLEPSTPPNVLYHGTADRNLPSIKENGLLRGKRDYVHLSPDEAIAIKVGTRHGRPVVLTIDAKAMAEAGHLFYLSDNGVWLTAYVPSKFIGSSV